ncbi:MAG: LCP family protein [Lachnospiraceae bacterium]|nr:LCP family protein [Lachnospiraceae bacterium]
MFGKKSSRKTSGQEQPGYVRAQYYDEEGGYPQQAPGAPRDPQGSQARRAPRAAAGQQSRSSQPAGGRQAGAPRGAGDPQRGRQAARGQQAGGQPPRGYSESQPYRSRQLYGGGVDERARYYAGNQQMRPDPRGGARPVRAGRGDWQENGYDPEGYGRSDRPEGAYRPDQRSPRYQRGASYTQGYDRRYDNRGRRGEHFERLDDSFDRRPRKKHTGLKVFLVILLLIIAIPAAAIGLTYGRLEHKSLKNVLTNAGLVGESGYRNIALFGVDSREGSLTRDTRSDTIMICSINKRTKEIRLASVYRDTYLDNADGSYRKATECYFYGGPQQAVNMLNKNLDLDIKDYMTVNFNAVVDIIDALGGIELEVTDEEAGYINGYCVENKEVTGADYTPLAGGGYVHLSGTQALAYCRIRYTEGWDYKRTERQRTVLTLAYQKALQKGVPGMLSLVNNLMPEVSTSMSIAELGELVLGMNSYRIGEQTGFPFNKMPADLADAGDCVVPVNLADNVSQLHSFLFGTSGYAPSQSVQEISSQIMNVTGIY